MRDQTRLWLSFDSGVHSGSSPESRRRAGGYCVGLRVPSCQIGMLGGAARNFASVRAIFLGVHPRAESTPDRLKAS